MFEKQRSNDGNFQNRQFSEISRFGKKFSQQINKKHRKTSAYQKNLTENRQNFFGLLCLLKINYLEGDALIKNKYFLQKLKPKCFLYFQTLSLIR